jgi:hypothetical protein
VSLAGGGRWASWLGHAALVVASVAVAGGVAVSAASDAEALTYPGVVRVTAVESWHTRVASGSVRTAAGTVEVARLRLFNTRITPRPIGRAELTCVSTGTGSRSCTMVAALPRGQIVAGGVIASKLFFQLAVYGGTGLYNNVRGTLTVTSLWRTPVTDLLLYRLVE